MLILGDSISSPTKALYHNKILINYFKILYLLTILNNNIDRLNKLLCGFFCLKA